MRATKICLCQVCIFGDLGRKHGNSTPSIIRNGLAGMFDFIIHVGDIAYDLQGDDGVNGDKFMNQLEPIISRVPYMVVAGNHEFEDGNFSNFQKRFWMPTNGLDGNQFYSFDLGPVHWIALNTEYYGYYQDLGKQPVLDQYDWLLKNLQAAYANRVKVPWIFTYLHRPFYCSAAHKDDCTDPDSILVRAGNEDLPGLEKPFIQYGVDVGFSGHVHFYERFYPVANFTYWNSGCHSSGTKFDKNPVPFSAKRLNDYGYTIVSVANMTHIHVQQLSLDQDEAIVDDFWISKTKGFMASNQMR
ncbi:Ser/Thr phosphatase family protein [Oesophagostomum dentatum]|uniref:Ser/Thr phosphatase family protein n=1 Tax=Oesophagostomum dentatum TaxID=61180 RepID=A0A0B1SNT2_OESDE|nr:Ser/Thr phosphatase family protein [Oesophagostomum dentatum]